MNSFKQDLGNCFYHPERKAWGVCDVCNNAICLEDKNPDDIRDRAICDYCLDTHQGLEKEEETFEQCYYHPETIASSNCAMCQKPICPASEYPYINNEYLCIMCNENYTPKNSAQKDFSSEERPRILITVVTFFISFVIVLIAFFLIK